MNTAKYVDELIAAGKAAGENLQSLAWRAGKACEGWPYVYGAWGAECTPSERRKRLRYHPEKTEISKKCQVLNGSSLSCPGCKWYPNNERVRCFDCRGFTDWLLNRVYDFDLYGDSVGVQWRTAVILSTCEGSPFSVILGLDPRIHRFFCHSERKRRILGDPSHSFRMTKNKKTS